MTFLKPQHEILNFMNNFNNLCIEYRMQYTNTNTNTNRGFLKHIAQANLCTVRDPL